MLEYGSTDTCYQENKFRGKSVRMIKRNTAEQMIFQIRFNKGLGGVGIFLVEKCINKVIDISKKIERMIVITVLVPEIITSVISVCPTMWFGGKPEKSFLRHPSKQQETSQGC